MKTKSKPWIVTVVVLLGTIGVLAGTKASQIGTMIGAGKSYLPPPESVTTAKVESTVWEVTRAAIGTLVAVHGVTLGAELPGVVRQIAFDSGTVAKQGAVLIRLDTSAEESQLAATLADASLARINLERAVSLRQGGSNTPADLDAAEARAKQTEAMVATLRATIAKKIIRAPFDGRIGIRQVELGQYLSAGAPIASLQSVDPIYAEFSLPQQALEEVKVGQRVRLHTDVFKDASWEGKVTTVNPEVDVATRNVRMRATFPNADGRLRPGMFANVEVISSEKRDVLIVPATSVLYAPYGDSVFLVTEKSDQTGKVTSVVKQQLVRLGDRRGDYVAVLAGLSPGEVVVSNGGFKLRNGMTVVANNALAPSAELTPAPADR